MNSMKKYLVLASVNKKIKKNTYYLSNSSYNYKKNPLTENKILFRDIFHEKNFMKKHSYLKSINEKVLIFLTQHLNKKFSLKNDIEYWRIILYYWISGYTAQHYSAWELVKKLKTKSKFYVETLSDDPIILINKDYVDWSHKINCHFYNFHITKRIIQYCNLKNIIFIKSKNIIKDIKTQGINNLRQKNILSQSSLKYLFLRYFDLIISKITFKFNSIYFDNFYYPFRSFINLCFKLKVTPTKNKYFFMNKKPLNKDLYNLEQRNKNLFKNNKKKRDDFYNYLITNILADLPMSYYEHYKNLKDQIIKRSKYKKTIVSMHAILINDLFKIYTAETKKNGSRLICVDHGGQIHKFRAMFDYLNIICDAQVHWNIRDKNYKFSTRLSPTKFISDFKQQNTNDNFCTIITSENTVFGARCHSLPGLDDYVREFEDVLVFGKSLKPVIQKKLKLRSKDYNNIDVNSHFRKIFGKKSTDQYGSSTFERTMLRSKLIIFTYAQTAFMESMYYNKPSILLIWKNDWIFQDVFYKHIKQFQKQQMAFENMKSAGKFINKRWDRIDDWWKSRDVQLARKSFLKDFFNVKKSWHQDWVNYFIKEKKNLH